MLASGKVVIYGGFMKHGNERKVAARVFLNLKFTTKREMTFVPNFQTLYRKSVALNVSIDVVAHNENVNLSKKGAEKPYLSSSHCFSQEVATQNCWPAP